MTWKSARQIFGKFATVAWCDGRSQDKYKEKFLIAK